MAQAIELYWKQDPGHVHAGDFLPSIFKSGRHDYYGLPGTALAIEMPKRDDGSYDLCITFLGVKCPKLTALVLQVYRGQEVDQAFFDSIGFILLNQYVKRTGQDWFKC